MDDTASRALRSRRTRSLASTRDSPRARRRTVWNALTYPSIGGYDAQEYITYARDLVEHARLPPGGVGAYYTPPGYWRLRDRGGSLGAGLDLHDPDHPGQLVSAVAVDRHGSPARSSPRTDVLAGATGRLAGSRRTSSPSSHRREDGCDVPSRAARNAPDGGRATRPRAHGSHAAVRVVARGARSGCSSARASSFAHGRSGWLRSPSSSSGGRGDRSRSLRRRVADGDSRSWCCSRCSFPPRGTCTRRRGTRIRSSTARSRTRSCSRAGPLAFYVDARVPDVVRQPVVGTVQRPLLAGALRRDVGRLLRHLVVGARSSGQNRCDRRDAGRVRASLGVLPTALALIGLVALLGLAVTRPREDRGTAGRRVASRCSPSRRSSSSRLRIPRPTATRSRGRTRWRLHRLSRSVSASRSTCLSRRRAVGLVLGRDSRRLRTRRAPVPGLVSTLVTADGRRAERRWVAIGVAVVGAAILVAGARRPRPCADAPTSRRTSSWCETCLTERSTPFEPVVGDPVALSAGRGALRTTVDGNAVTVALGGSDSDAERVYDAYTAVGTGDVASRLERRRRVVLLWDSPPTAAQRAFMTLCTLDAQD